MNKIDPLFAIEAEQMLLSGFTHEAIDLCCAGLLRYPDYALAYIILIRAYLLTGEIAKAEKLCDIASARFLNNKIIKNLRNEINSSLEIEAIETEIITDKNRTTIHSLINTDINLNYFSDNQPEEMSFDKVNFYHKRKTNDLFKTIEFNIEENISVDKLKQSKNVLVTNDDKFFDNENFSTLVGNISKTKITTPLENRISKNDETEEPIVISETMAAIYAGQGQYSAVVKAYTALQEKHPEKQEYFAEKINEILELQNNK